MGFVFFDTETSGLSPPFDQILQFAAVHTDHDLVEIERFEVRSKFVPTRSPSQLPETPSNGRRSNMSDTWSIC